MKDSDAESSVIRNPVVREQALRFLFAELPGVTTLQLAFPLAVVAVCWNSSVGKELLLGWMIGLFVMYGLRIVLATRFNHRIDHEELNIERWGGYFTLTSLIVGGLWGAAGALFYVPSEPTLQILLYVIIIGTGAGQIIITANWLPALYAFNTMALGILSLSLLLRGDGPERALAVLLFLFLLMVIRVARQARRVIYEGIALRYENFELIQQLKREKHAAEQANMAKTRFLASANHDLRQPVHAIKLLAYALKSELASSRSKVLFKYFDASIQGLSNLLESLLDLSKLEAGAITPTPSHFKLDIIFNQLLGEFMPMASEKQLKYSVRPTSISITSDQTLLTNLLRNLITNAFRYVPDGGVLLAARMRDGCCVIEVWDNGPGISDEERSRIFEPFYQIDNFERDKAGGLGLGLAICRQLANILDAELDFRSRLGAGTVFRLTLPRSAIAASDVPSAPAKVIRPFTGITHGRHVLIVDDEQQVLVAMRATLESLGMSCDTADGPEQALQIIQQQGVPDQIICDHRLRGGLTSLDLIKQLQQHLKQLPPFIIITGDTAPERLLEACSTGYPVLHKPVDMDELQGVMFDQQPC